MQNVRRLLSLNRGWLFHDGEVDAAGPAAHNAAYLSSKTRLPDGVMTQNFDDTGWQSVNLPHDFVLTRLPEQEYGTFMGCRRRGIVWYRRHFRLEESDRGKNIELIFDGASSRAEVWFNGAPVCTNDCGYTGFRCDVTPMAEYGDFLNTVAVRVDASRHEGWWYEGGGLYRDTWLLIRSPQYILTDGVYANPVQTDGVWHIPVQVETGNTGTEECNVYAISELLDDKGILLSSARSSGRKIPVFGNTAIEYDLPAPENIRLWDLDSPALYTVRTRLYREDGILLDEAMTRCGFRTIAFDAEKGFFLNGRSVKLQGTCNHQDHACTGVAVPKSIERFRLLKLKEMGCNAYRCAHNPPTASLLDLCDELGMLVMDENRHYSTADVYLDQLRWLVRRDRNHPSVILWSIFNEEPLQSTPVGYEMARKMSAIVKQLDNTRFTTGAMNGGFLTPLNASHAIDVTGINYYIHSYDEYHRIAPGQPVLSSEDASAVASRGITQTDWEAHTLADDDSEAVPWGATNRTAWREIAERSWMAGGFAWTGFDYRGEPTPYPYPSNSSFFGILDLCGFPKNAFYLRQAFWRNDLAVLRTVPHWNLSVEKGTTVSVSVISSKAESVELFLNGRSFGVQKTVPFDMNRYDIPYEPGTLRAVSYDGNGNIIAVYENETAGKPSALVLEADRGYVADDGYDCVPVTVYAADAAGRRVPDAENLIRFSVRGAGEIIGTANGDQNSLADELSPERNLFSGYAMTMIRSAVGGSGSIILRAESDGLEPAETVIEIKTGLADREYAATPPRFRMFNDWICSQFYEEKPDPNVVIGKDDMNSWERVFPGTKLQTVQDKRFILYRADVSGLTESGKRMLFRAVTGKACCYIDGKLIHAKETYAEESTSFCFSKGFAGNELTVLLEGDPSDPAPKLGLTGQVVVENQS